MPDTLTIIAIVSQVIAIGFVAYLLIRGGKQKSPSRKSSPK